MNTDWLDTKAYPFAAKYFSVNGVQMHYIDEGAGDVLLFVHGTPSWSFEFRHAITDLSKNFRCIAMDHIGFGLSDKPKDYDYSTQNHAATLEKFISHLNLSKFNLLVHDFGGPIGLHYAVAHPDKIEKLVILNTWCRSITEEPEFKKMKNILGSPLLPFLYRNFNFSAKYILPAAFGERSRLTKETHQQFLKPFSKASERNGTVAFAKSLLHDQDWFESIWKQINVLSQKPALLIWGMKDTFIKEKYLLDFEQVFSNSTTVKYADCGHFVLEEKSIVAAPAIAEFIKK